MRVVHYGCLKGSCEGWGVRARGGGVFAPGRRAVPAWGAGRFAPGRPRSRYYWRALWGFWGIWASGNLGILGRRPVDVVTVPRTEGALLFKPSPHTDERGFFCRTFDADVV